MHVTNTTQVGKKNVLNLYGALRPKEKLLTCLRLRFPLSLCQSLTVILGPGSQPVIMAHILEAFLRIFLRYS